MVIVTTIHGVQMSVARRTNYRFRAATRQEFSTSSNSNTSTHSLYSLPSFPCAPHGPPPPPPTPPPLRNRRPNLVPRTLPRRRPSLPNPLLDLQSSSPPIHLTRLLSRKDTPRFPRFEIERLYVRGLLFWRWRADAVYRAGGQ